MPKGKPYGNTAHGPRPAETKLLTSTLKKPSTGHNSATRRQQAKARKGGITQ